MLAAIVCGGAAAPLPASAGVPSVNSPSSGPGDSEDVFDGADLPGGEATEGEAAPTDPAPAPEPTPVEPIAPEEPSGEVTEPPTPLPDPAPEPPASEEAEAPASTPEELAPEELAPEVAPEELAPESLPEADEPAARIGARAAGIAEEPRPVWIESFEEGLTNSASGLPAYAAGRYTASAGWVNGTSCTGVLVNYLAPYPNAQFCPSQNVILTTTAAAREARRLADVLGQVAAGVVGSTSDSAPANGYTAAGTRTNHALVSLPYSTVTGGSTVLQSVDEVGLTAPDRRYYALELKAAGASCGNPNASLQLSLFSGSTTLLTGFSSPVVPCGTSGNVFYTSPTLPASGGFFDPALQGSVRAATYTGTNVASLTPAQIADARVRLVNTVSGASRFGVDDVSVLDVTPALDVAFESPTASATMPTTLTYTITNTSDLLAKTDWGFAATLPPGLVVAPGPGVVNSCPNVTGAATAVTAAAGSSTLTAAGGDLAAGTTSCTISVEVVAAATGTVTSGTVTPSGLIVASADELTVVPATTITVRKNLPTRTAAGDQFTLSLRSGATVLASATTSGTAVGLQAAQISRAVVESGATYTIHEAQTSGAGIGYANAYECTWNGTVIAAGAGSSGTLAIPDESGAEVVCTFTNTARSAQLFCDANRFYSVTAAGVLQQGDIVSGGVATVGSWPGATGANSLGVGAGGTLAYALDRSTSGNQVSAILKWTPGSGFQRLPNSSYTTVAGGTTITGSIVTGAIDPSSGRYLFGTFANSQFYLWSFTETAPAASRFALVGSFPTGTAPNGNGDMAFDAQGNLYVVGSAGAGSASSAAIYTVTSQTLAAASGGTLAVSPSVTRPLTGTDAAFTNVNGIAFSPRGTVYLANAGSAYEFDATTWARVPGTPRVLVDSVDLGGCTSPSTLTVLKNVVGRLAAGDQFTLTASTGSPPTAFATATTSGAATGRQSVQIGPFPAPTGSTVTVSEAMAAGSASAIGAYTSVYECWTDGVRVSNGSGASGTVVMPNRLSANVICTYFNSPRPASTVRITKTIQEFSGLTRPGADWSVGTTATATAGTATALPSEATRQQTDAAGQASWSVLFGSTLSRATIVVSEVQQPGFAFASGSCTVNGAPTPVTFTQAGTVVSARLANIASATTVECSIVNRPTASLTLAKSVAFGSALPTDWVLGAVGPDGALPGPFGRSGTAAASGVPVTPGVAYRLSETGGPLTYEQTGAWQCLTATGVALDVTAEGDVVPTDSGAITCTVTNATAVLTLLNQVQSPQAGFQAQDWRVTAAPGPLAGAALPTENRLGAEYVASGNPDNTFEVRPGHSYTLSQAATDPTRPLAYQELRLERLDGSTWTPVSSSTVSAPAAGQAAVYRFVNAPVDPTTLPLTGGTGADAFLIAGGSVSVLALALSVWHGRRRRGGAL